MARFINQLLVQVQTPVINAVVLNVGAVIKDYDCPLIQVGAEHCLQSGVEHVLLAHHDNICLAEVLPGQEVWAHLCLMAESLQVGKRVDASWDFISVTGFHERVVERASFGFFDVWGN